MLLALGFLGPERSLPEQFGCELDARGNILADADKQTTAPGVFTAGDCTRGQSLVVWAINEGRAAARGVDGYLKGEFLEDRSQWGARTAEVAVARLRHASNRGRDTRPLAPPPRDRTLGACPCQPPSPRTATPCRPCDAPGHGWPARRQPAAATSAPLLRRFTLAFTDAALERRYQLAVGREGLGGYRLSCAFGALLWLIATQVVPVRATADPWLPLLVGLIGASMNIGGLLASRWTTTVDRQNGLATPIAIVNGWAALLLAATMGVTEAYAASALILIGVYFFVAKVRFVFALIRIVGLLAGFAVVAALSRDPGSLALDAFILVAALSGVLIALYRLELAARRLFRNDLTIAEQTAGAVAREPGGGATAAQHPARPHRGPAARWSRTHRG